MRQLWYPRSFYYVTRHAPIELSPLAQERLRWLKVWQRLRQRGLSGQAAAEILKLPRATLYRWQRRLEREGLKGLGDRSRRPRRVRQPEWRPDLAAAVVRLREPPRNGVARPKRPVHRPYAVRKPKQYPVPHPGELVQLDTLEVRPLPGVVLKHFTARDMVSRWDVVRAYRSATAHTATAFLDRLLERTPFPVRALQVDGGSEFQASFEQASAERGIRLFVLPPHSPELNGHVERAQRTHAEEFYDLYLGDLDVNSVNEALGEWERVYNNIRPHQSLDQKTPAEYLSQHPSGLAPPSKLSHIVLNQYP